MSETVRITVEDNNALMGTYDSIQLERAGLVDGVYALQATISLVIDTYNYSYTDAGGNSNSWYRYRFYSTLSQSAYSDPFKAEYDVTRLSLRQKVLEDYKLGMRLIVSGDSTLLKLFTVDYRFNNSGRRTGRGVGSFINFTSGNCIGMARNVVDSNPTFGSFDVSPALLATPAPGDEVEWNWVMTPYDINLMINKGIARYWYVDRVPVTAVSSGEFSLAQYPWIRTEKAITGLWYYPQGSTIPRPWLSSGRWWNFSQDSSELKIKFSPTPGVTDVLYLEVLRQPPPLYTDDSTLVPILSLDLLAAFVYDEILKFLINPAQQGASADRASWQEARAAHRGILNPLIQMYRAKPHFSLPDSDTPNVFFQPYRAR